MKLEPLKLSDQPGWWKGYVPILSPDGKEIARVQYRKDYAYDEVARRIVACVNACEGRTDDQLEAMRRSYLSQQS